jgi:hypothetical protein
MQLAKTQISFQGFKAFVLLFLLLFNFRDGFSQNKPSVKWGRFNFLSVDSTWKYRPGPATADFFETSFDDKDWISIKNAYLETLTPHTPGWPGIGTFRKRFNVPDSLKHVAAELFIAQIGASRIYLDGKLICQFGVPDGKPKDEFAIEYPVKVELDGQSTHTLVLYYANHLGPVLNSKFNPVGYGIELSPDDKSYVDTKTAFPHAVISLCIILSFCLFFCFVYGFYPHRLASLMSVLFLASFSCIFAGGLLQDSTHDIWKLILAGNLWQLGFCWHAGFLLLFHYSIYYNRLPKRSLLVVLAMIIEVVILDFNFDKPTPLHLIIPFTLLFQVESWRIVILGIRKKKNRLLDTRCWDVCLTCRSAQYHIRRLQCFPLVPHLYTSHPFRCHRSVFPPYAGFAIRLGIWFGKPRPT